MRWEGEGEAELKLEGRFLLPSHGMERGWPAVYEAMSVHVYETASAGPASV